MGLHVTARYSCQILMKTEFPGQVFRKTLGTAVRKIERSMIMGLHVTARYSCQILMKTEFPGQVFRKTLGTAVRKKLSEV
jgi:hypothetical protein